MLEVRDEHVLSYSWTDAAYAGELDSVVTWTLHPGGRGTRLFLEHRGFAAGDAIQQRAHGQRLAHLPHRTASEPARHYLHHTHKGAPVMTTATDYTAWFSVTATPERASKALTSTEEMTQWWTSSNAITGSADEGGLLRFSLPGADDQLIVRVDAARPTAIAWSVEECAVQPEWTGTKPTFTLHARHDGGTDVAFHHVGLSPEFEYWDTCQAGWDWHLASLQRYLAA